MNLIPTLAPRLAHSWSRRRDWLRALPVLGLCLARPATGASERVRDRVPAKASEAALREASIAFDRLYIPPLFLTGRATASPEGPARAQAALSRLRDRWPVLRAAFAAAAPGDPRWRGALARIDDDLRRTDRLARARQWPEAHEALEPIRERLWNARRAHGLDYPLDRYTAYHAAMEHLFDRGAALKGVAIGQAGRAGLTADFTRARVLWLAVERADVSARAFGLDAPREAQWRSAVVVETQALATLSQALANGSDATVLQAVAAIKAPFVRAYTAFGEG